MIHPRKKLSVDETEQYYLENDKARFLALFTICLGTMLGPLTLATVNLALPTIAIELDANARIISWIPTGFLLSSVVFMLPIGKLSDAYGRKRFYLAGAALTAVSSLVASAATSAEWILFWRLFQGLSMAMLFGTGMAILVSIFPENRRGFAMGLYSASVYLALTLSPVLGGLCTEYLGWRSVFWIQAPVAAIVCLLIVVAMPGEWRSPDKQPFDWTGSTIFAFWAISFVFGLGALPDLSAVFTLFLSAAFLVLFVWHQSRVPHPLLSMALFTGNRIFPFSLAAGCLMYASMYPLSFLLSLLLQFSKGMSPASAGLIMLLQAMTMVLVAPLAGKLSDRFETRIVATLGCFCSLVGFIVMLFVSSETPNWLIGLSLICIGFGFGFFTTPNNSAAMGSVGNAELGTASAAVNLSRTIGNLVGMSVVMLVIHTFIGTANFSPDLNDELLETVHVWMRVAAVFTVLATIMSLTRGKTRMATSDAAVAASSR